MYAESSDARPPRPPPPSPRVMRHTRPSAPGDARPVSLLRAYVGPSSALIHTYAFQTVVSTAVSGGQHVLATLTAVHPAVDCKPRAQ